MQQDKNIIKGAFLDRVLYNAMHKKPECSIWVIMTIEAPLDDTVLKNALEQLIKAFPLISSRFEAGLWQSRWVYEDPGDLSRVINRQKVPDNTAADKLLKGVVRNHMDTDILPLVKILSVDSPENHYFIFQVHHIIIDGEGAKRLFSLFAEIYRSLEKNPGFTLSPLPDTNRSLLQMAKHVKWYRWFFAPCSSFNEISLILKFVFKYKRQQWVISNGVSADEKNIGELVPSYDTFTINREELENIRKNTDQYKATINDICMAALMTTVCQWNISWGGEPSCINSIYTIDLRRWLGEPAGTLANMSGSRIISIDAHTLLDVHQALLKIKKEFDSKKKTFGLKELWDNATAMVQPKIMGKIICSQLEEFGGKSHAFSNVGIIPETASDFGSVKGTSCLMNAPVLPGAGIIFTVSGYKGSLTFCCNFNSSYINPEKIKKLLKLFKKNLLLLSADLLHKV